MNPPFPREDEFPNLSAVSIPARIAAHYTIFPLGEENGRLTLAVPQYLSRQTDEELRIILGKEIDYRILPKPEIEKMIYRHYGVGAGVIETLVEGKTENRDFSEVEQLDPNKNDDATITRLVNDLIRDALIQQASDIHVEPFEQILKIRYRVDGLLREAQVSDRIRALAPGIISRIKIMARLDIGEKRLPQDGRIKIIHAGDEIDLRVSVLPSCHGESVVIRILKSLALLSLEDLGFEASDLIRIRRQIAKPHGIILVTGPTGSGKTTTLYACLKELNQTERKIITIEDPVEYKLPGIVQMQVNTKTGFGFPAALRSMLRHDPDVLMVGEIRDAETAEIAVRSALTGHLVLSTLHTNDAASAVTRLIEMGIEPYLVASTLEAVISQRLVRRFCAKCRYEKRNGCEFCLESGYAGRIAIHEMMPMTSGLRELISEKKPLTSIRKQTLQDGMIPLPLCGEAKVKQGMTSREEVARVVLSDEWTVQA